MYEMILPELIIRNDTKLVMLVIDGLGGTTDDNGLTELEAANTPRMDKLAASGSTGIQRPVGIGITPGSGPGHLALFGFDPVKYQIGRGILEALGIGMKVGKGELAVRGNFCTMVDGIITDRRAGRISSEQGQKYIDMLSSKIKRIFDIEVKMAVSMEYRFAVIFKGSGLSDMLSDADPQVTGERPVTARPLKPNAEKSARIINKFIKLATEILIDQHPANSVLMRGYSLLPNLQHFVERYGLRAVGIATYPMYRGLASLVGMDTPNASGFSIAQEFEMTRKLWDKYDFFFIHIKKTDSMGEDGNFAGKVQIIEDVDREIQVLLDLDPDVLVITGDHATPSVLKSHSWHGVPLLLSSKFAFRDDAEKFSERECEKGILGHFPGFAIVPLMLANAQRLKKFGA